ncbi:hypothetical protein [Snuella lapsa]
MSSIKKIHFIHIGKTGGTAIKYALEPYSFTKKHQIVLNKHNLGLMDVPKGEKVFFCVRGPILRFINAFYSRLRLGRPRYYAPWINEETVVFKNFETPNELAKI